MLLDLQKILTYSLLVLAICGGVIFGRLSGQLVDLTISTEELLPPKPITVQAASRQLQEADFQIVLDRNLFDSRAVGKTGEQLDLSVKPGTSGPEAPAVTRSELTLIGTVVAGEDSLALIQVGNKAGVYRLKEEIAPGTTVVEINRHMVAVLERGIRRELVLKKLTQPQPRLIRPGKPAASEAAVVPLGDNRWQISRTAAENARANLNKLLQSARMVPQLQNGKTVGFRLVELDPGSLLEQIGLRVGDLLVEINQVQLNSPEKALQVFQQVREASNISLGLVRNGKRETFEYRFE